MLIIANILSTLVADEKKTAGRWRRWANRWWTIGQQFCHKMITVMFALPLKDDIQSTFFFPSFHVGIFSAITFFNVEKKRNNNFISVILFIFLPLILMVWGNCQKFPRPCGMCLASNFHFLLTLHYKILIGFSLCFPDCKQRHEKSGITALKVNRKRKIRLHLFSTSKI